MIVQLLKRSIVPAAVLLLAAGVQAANAADPPVWSPAPTAKLPLSELSSGWYLRGDIGYRFNRIGTPDTVTPVASQQFENAYSAGGGIGYKYKWFRTDLTIDYGGQAIYRGLSSAGALVYGTKIDGVSILANGYLDLGTWSGFTPYIGAGVGTSWLRTSDYTSSTVPSVDAVPVTGKWNLAWAAMGGASFQFAPNWVADVGYRYLRLGDAIGGMEPTPATFPAKFKGVSAQEVRIGFRFLID